MGPRQQRQRGTGSSHFKEGELDRLLNLIDEGLRREDNGWQLVADDYSTYRPREFPEREKIISSEQI